MAGVRLETEPAEAREFFETRFRPFRLARLGEAEGFLTGYYEPVVEGSRVPTQDFKVPMYRRPQDMVVAGRHRPGASRILPNRGPVWRRAGKKLVPYYDRAEIESGPAGRVPALGWTSEATGAIRRAAATPLTAG